MCVYAVNAGLVIPTSTVRISSPSQHPLPPLSATDTPQCESHHIGRESIKIEKVYNSQTKSYHTKQHNSTEQHTDIHNPHINIIICRKPIKFKLILFPTVVFHIYGLFLE